MEAIKKNQFERVNEFDEERAIARVITSKSGGPIRTIITGREPHATGRFVSIKAGLRAMPWESIKCELPALLLAEAGSPIRRLLAQPHRLEIRVKGHGRPLVYFPDLILTVDRCFVDQLASGVPFARAVADWRPGSAGSAERCLLVVEVKDDDDRRKNDPEYRVKLAMAAEVYRRWGWQFIEIIRSRDIEVDDVLKFARRIALDAHTKVDVIDAARAVDAIGSFGGVAPHAAVCEHLGGPRLGRAKLAALHVRRVVSLDISRPLHPDTPVRIVGDGDTLM